MDLLERAILRTLTYYDIFDWPLNLDELQLYLIEERAAYLSVKERALEMVKRGKLGTEKDLYFLSGRKGLADSRKEREKIATEKIKRAKKLASWLKLVPWIRMVGLTGSLSVGDGHPQDDLDLLIVAARNRLFLARAGEFLLFTILGVRRRAGDKEFRDKVCPNLYLDESKMEVSRDLCTAHDLIRLIPLWEKKGTYVRLLLANDWYDQYFPNWEPILFGKSSLSKNPHRRSAPPGDLVEKVARSVELWYLKKKKTSEKIFPHALYFHPQDRYQAIQEEFGKRMLALDKENPSR